MADQPKNTPVIQKPTPVVLDELLLETSESNQALYDRFLEVGHYHPDRIKYPAYRLVKQQPNAYGSMQYWWANDFTAQDGYNATVDYAENSNAYPTFVRSYRVLRSDYLVTGPSTKELAFTGIVSIAVTNGGTGYTTDFAITFTGGSGSGLAGTAITDGRGAIIRIELTNVGTGFTGAPVITFTNGSGAGAAATAVIQPTTCLLVEEKHGKLPEDDPHASLYDLVRRTWMTLPGPAITTTRLDDDGVTVTITRQRMAVGSIATSEAVTTGVWIRKWKGEGDAVQAVQITESRPVNVANSALTASKYDPESNTVYTEARTRKETSTITEGGSVVTGSEVIVESDPITELVAWELVKTFPDATAHDLTNAITISEESAPYQFPATVDSTQYAASGGLIGYTKAFVRHVPHLTKVFFVIGTKPLLTDYVVPPAPAAMFALTLGGDPISDAIYDGVALLYNGITATYPGSTPSLTVYKADWLNQLKPVLGSVREAGSKFRWKVEVTFITFLLPSLPAYS